MNKLIKKIKCYFGFHKLQNACYKGKPIYHKCKNCGKMFFK